MKKFQFVTFVSRNRNTVMHHPVFKLMHLRLESHPFHFNARQRDIARAVALCSLFWGAAVGAQNLPDTLDRQNQLIERQQLDRLREDQDRALRALQPPGGTDLRQVQPPASATPDLGANCRDIGELRLVGGTQALPDSLRTRLQTDYTGRCLGTADIEALLAAVTKSYIERGYITTRAYLAAQNLSSGVLEVTIVEGTVERFELKQSGAGGASPSVRGAFPVSPGELLNLRDLEQGIDQLNSLSSNNASLDVQPGSKPGQSVVVVNNQASRPVRLFSSVDTLGQSATGRTSASNTVSLYGLLGFNELLAITRRQTAPMDSAHNSVSTALRAVVPFGYTTFSYDWSESRYVNTLQLPSGNKLAAEGTTLTHSLGADHVVYRDQANRLTLSARLNVQRTQSWLGGEFLAVSSRTISTLDIGASAFSQLGGGVLNARVGYVRGLKAFGALRDTNDLADGLPHAQFDKYTLDFGFARGFTVAGRPLQWTSQFSGQYTGDTLYGSQQILVGGSGTVRGAVRNLLSGDSGYFLRNELSLPWRAPADGPAMNGRLYVAYDFGHVSNRVAGVPSGSMSGITLGGAVQWGALTLDVFASRTLHVPAPMKAEAVRVGLRMSYSL